VSVAAGDSWHIGPHTACTRWNLLTRDSGRGSPVGEVSAHLDIVRRKLADLPIIE
jgi:hypothetical protein